METSINIQPEEYSTRINHLLQIIQEDGLSGVVLFDNFYILYYTGFAFVPTERPIAFVLSSQGERAMFVPRLEAEHAKSHSIIQRVDSYLEYPYKPHPMELLKEMLVDMNIGGAIGADQDGYPWILGYRGPVLSSLMDAKVHKISGFIEDQMMIKSECRNCLDPGKRQVGAPGTCFAAALYEAGAHRNRGKPARQPGSQPGDAGHHRADLPGAKSIF